MKIQLRRIEVSMYSYFEIMVFDQNGCFRVVEKDYPSKNHLSICQDFHSCPSHDSYTGYNLITDLKPNTSLFAIVAPMLSVFKQESIDEPQIVELPELTTLDFKKELPIKTLLTRGEIREYMVA